MKCFNSLTVIAACAMFFLLPACTKEKKTTSCSSDIYGYNGSGLGTYPTGGTTNYGKITPSTGTATTLQTFMATTYSNQGAYNTSDFCYYVFKIYNTSHSNTLYRVNASTGVTSLMNSTGVTEQFDGLVYNNANSKLYCFKGDTAGPRIAELTIGSTTFTANVVATDPNVGYSVVSSTANPNTGDIYYEVVAVSGGAYLYKIMKYHPAGTPTVVTSGSGAMLLGLRYNRTTHMLNAVRPNATSWTSASEFVSVDPATGTTTTVSSLPFGANQEFYSAVIDSCTNHYIFSPGSASSTGTLREIDAAGAVVNSATTTGEFQGMDVKYW